MNKKSTILLVSVLVLLSLSVYYAMAELSALTFTTNSGDNGWITEASTQVNFTITSTTAVTSFSIVIPENNVLWDAWSLGCDGPENLGEGTLLTNMTLDASGNPWPQWSCSNLTGDASGIIWCNISDATQGLGTTGNTSMIVMLRLNDKTTNTEDYYINFTVTNGTGYDIQSGTLNSDPIAPVLINLNVTDGTMMLNNGSLSQAYGLSTRGVNWTVEATIWDTNLATTVTLGYRCDGTNESFLKGDTNITRMTPAPTSGALRYVTGIIDSTCFTANNGDATVISFSLEANDTFNHPTTLNETTTGGTFNIMGMYDTLPRISSVNVTTTSNQITTTLTSASSLDGSGDYLSPSNATFDVVVEGNETKGNLILVWNETGAGTTVLIPTSGAWSVNNLDLATISTVPLASGHTGGEGLSIYTTSLILNSNSSDFAFYVYMNNSGVNYTAIGGPYRFTIDSGGPSVTMTPPADLTIAPRGSITYTCSATDTYSGFNGIKWELQKAGETSWSTVQDFTALDSGSSDSIAFSGDYTSAAGTYSVKCTVRDALGNDGVATSTSSQDFKVAYSTTTDTSGESSGGGSVASVDLSTAEEATIVEPQGTIKTFTLDGITVHKIKIKTVDEVAGTVTIVIESNPIEITLKIGETKEVDVDDDKVNDISVTLNRIVNGQADITTKRLAPLAPVEEPKEETKPTTTPTEEIKPTTQPTTQAGSKAWLWILIIVIIVVIGVGYWFVKRK